MGGEIVDLTRRLERAESQLHMLVTRFLPPVLNRLEIVEKDNASLRKWLSELIMPDAPTPIPAREEAPVKRRTRKKPTYEMLTALVDLVGRGHSLKAAAEAVGVPYSTAHKLMSLSSAEQEALRLKSGEAAGTAPPPPIGDVNSAAP